MKEKMAYLQAQVTTQAIIKNKNILFIDFNGVISYQTFWASLGNPKHKYHQYFSPIEEFIFKENTELVKDWMLGKYSSEQIHRLIAKKVNISYEDILKIFIEDCQNLDISKEILERVKNLRQYYYCILATDNMDSFDRFTLTSNPELIESFDEINNSSAIGIFKSKDNGQYFKDKISQRNAVTKNSILIDDSKSNCKVFYSINGQAYNTKNEREVLMILEKILKKVKSKWEC